MLSAIKSTNLSAENPIVQMSSDEGAMTAPNVLKFPRLFCHYSRILHTPSTYVIVAHCFSIVWFIQQIALSLFPLLIRARREDRPVTWVHKVICFFLYFRSDFPWNYAKDMYDSQMLIFLACFIIPCGICYAQYILGFETPIFLKQTRCLTVFLQPNVVVLALVIHSSKYLNRLLTHGFAIDTVLMLGIETIVTCVALVMNNTFWPLIQQNPMLGDAQIPSRLIPDSGNDKILQVELLLSVVASLMPNWTSAFVVSLAIAGIGVARWRDVWGAPYMSMYYTVVHGMLGMSFAGVAALFWISMRWQWLSDGRLTFFAVLLNIISFGVSMMKYMRLESEVVRELTEHAQMEFASAKEAIRVAQFAVLNNCITEELIQSLHDLRCSEKNLHVTMARIYCEILISDGNYSKELEESARNLFTLDSIPMIERFIAYQLYQTVIHDKVICDDHLAIQAIEERVEEYKNSTDEFWTCTISGDIRKALEIMKNLSYVLTELTCDFDNLFNFYPNDPQILMMEYQFFRHFRSTPSDRPQSFTADWIRMGPMLKEKHLRYIGAAYFTRIEMDGNDESESLSRTSSGSQDGRFRKITESLQVYFTGHLSATQIVLLTLSAVMLFVLCTCSVVPIQKYTDMTSNLGASHILMSYLWYMTIVSSKVWTLVAHLATNTTITDRLYVNWSPKTQEFNMENFGESIFALHYSLASMKQVFVLLAVIPEFADFWNFWSHVRVNMSICDVPERHGKETEMDVRTHILYFSSLIAELIRVSPTKNISSSTKFIQLVKKSPEGWFRSADRVSESTYASMKFLDGFTGRLNKRLSSSFESGFVVFFVIAIVTACFAFLATLSIDRSIRHTILSHFRPDNHPNPDIHVVKSDSVKACFMLLVPRRYFLLVVLLILPVVIGVTWAQREVRSMATVVVQDMEILSAITRLVISCSMFYDSVFRNQQFPSTERVESALRLCEQLTADQNLVVKYVVTSSSSVPLKYFHRTRVFNASSSDDIFDELSILEISTAFMILGRDLVTSATQLFHEKYSKLTSIYRQKLLPEAQFTARSFIMELDGKIAALSSFTQIHQFFAISYSIIALLIVIWNIISIVLFMRQFTRFMNTIPLKTLAENDCMMSFFRTGSQNGAGEKEGANVMSEIYQVSCSSLVMCSMNQTIVAFSADAKAMFAYRTEQLVGQSLELLIPKEASLSGQNGPKFYQQLEIVRNDQTDLSFEKDLIGVASDGSFLQLHVSVSLVEFQNTRFFLLQMKSLSDLIYYDEVLSWYGEFHTNIIQGSYAFQLFPDYLRTRGSPLVQTAKHSALVGVYRDVAEGLTETMEKLMSESKLVEYLSGTTNCCILANSSNHVLVLFLERDGSDSYVTNAVRFYQQYCGSNMPFRGFVVTENETQLILFPPPPIPSMYKKCDIPISAAASLVPSITFEVIGPVIEAIPGLLKLLRTHKYVVSSDILGLLPSGEEQKIQVVDEKNGCLFYAVSQPNSTPEY